MTRKVERQTGSFEAIDEIGNEYTIFVFTTFHQWNDSDGQHETEGMRRLRTADGHAVNRIDQGEYEILDDFGNINVISNDPEAP